MTSRQSPSDFWGGFSNAYLLRVAFSRWHVERCFQDCKSELGLNHAELRTYKGLHRHLILTAVNYYFLQDQLALYKREKKQWN